VLAGLGVGADGFRLTGIVPVLGAALAEVIILAFQDGGTLAPVFRTFVTGTFLLGAMTISLG
jgi:hypothetical protein